MAKEVTDLRWKQRFQNYENARNKLYSTIAAYQQSRHNVELRTYLIESFEFTYKLGWKSVKDFLIYEGIRNIHFPRNVIKKGFRYNVIEDGQTWIDIIEDEDLLHYKDDEKKANAAIENITNRYMRALDQVYSYLKIKSKQIHQYGLPEKVIKHFCKLFKTYPDITEVKIYGSRAFGGCEHTSDVDLAYYTKSGKDITEELQQALLDLPTPYLFDVTNYSKVKHKPLKENIDRTGKTIYKKSFF